MHLKGGKFSLDMSIHEYRLTNWQEMKKITKLQAHDYPKVLINIFFEREIINIYLLISFSMCFGCSKEQSH